VEKLIIQANEILAQLDFEAIWPGFAQSAFCHSGLDPKSLTDPELLAAHMVRKMFVTFRADISSDETSVDYPVDLDNMQLKLAENHYLAKAFAENSMVDLQQFAVLRRARSRIIGEVINMEEIWENRDGTAEYAGLMALNQINRGKFVEAVGQHIFHMRRAENLLDMGKLSVSVGCMLCFVLRSFGVDLSKSRDLFSLIPHETTEIEALFNGIYRKN